MTSRPPASAGAGLAVALAMAAVLLGAVPRVVLALDALPDPLRPFVWSDVVHIWERDARGAALPYRDVAFEYPPATGMIWILIQTLAESAAVHVALWALVQAVAAGAVAYALAREAGLRRTLTHWSLAPQLFLYGSLNFETLALAPLVIAITLARRERPVAASAALAVGAAAKLFPAAVLPVVLVRASVRHARAAFLAAAVFVAVLGVAFAPTAAGPYSSLVSLSRYSAGIEPNLDSVAGLLVAAARAVGSDPLDAVIVVSIVGTIATFAVAVIPATRRARDVAVPAGLAIITVLLWSRLYSPQYSLWVTPFLALIGTPGRAFAWLTLADVIVFASVYPYTLAAPEGAARATLVAVLAAGVVLRHVALIGLWRATYRMASDRGA
jgi:uncharacterized membrane protein